MYVCEPEGKIIGEGVARSKKDAEQKAAKSALMHYGLIHGF
jgi:dsRNA-specific ribonuclease